MNMQEKAKAYVDKHKAEAGWVEKMILYYTDPEHPCRRHQYTEYILDYLYEN